VQLLCNKAFVVEPVQHFLSICIFLIENHLVITILVMSI